jgi:hypothetical protein
MTKTRGLTDFRVLATDSIGALGSELSNRKTSNAVASGPATPDPRVRFRDDCVPLQFESRKG